MKKIFLTLIVIGTSFCCFAQLNVVTTGNNVVDITNPKAADVVIGSDAGTRHDASIMWWSNTSASRISNTSDVFYLSQWTTTNPNIGLSAIVGNSSYFKGPLSIGNTSATHSLTLANSGTGFASYNTIDQTGAYERVVEQYQSNIYTIGSYAGVSGNIRSLMIGIQPTAGTTTLSSGRTFSINNSASTGAGNFNFNEGTAVAGSLVTFNTSVSGPNAGEQQNMVAIQGSVTQSNTAGYTALLIAPFESSVGSGNKYLIDAGVNSAGSGGGTHTSYMRLTDNGNMGIGATDVVGGWTLAGSTYKLNVGGNGIQTTAVTVQLVSNWADYVFKKEYKLTPLADLKVYVDQNHHLPEIPSAEQIAKDGLNLGEMNKILVKKVEELTLYMIDKDKQLKEQQAKNDELEHRLNAQQAQVDKLVKAVEELTNKANVKN